MNIDGEEYTVIAMKSPGKEEKRAFPKN